MEAVDSDSPSARLVRSILCGPRELYQTLRVDRTASQAAIQQAYLQLARDTHPDRNRTTGAQEAFKQVGHAKSILLDAATRAAYDAEIDGAPAAAKPKRRPCERRANRKRKERSCNDEPDREHATHTEGGGIGGAARAEGEGSDEELEHEIWCSFQARDTPSASSTEAHGSRAHTKMSNGAKRRAAASKARAVAGAGRLATEASSAAVRAGKGRGALGKRPWRRAARIAAKLDAKQAKARSRSRRHLQTSL
eukprot:607673-Prymnesium_polylepis.1